MFFSGCAGESPSDSGGDKDDSAGACGRPEGAGKEALTVGNNSKTRTVTIATSSGAGGVTYPRPGAPRANSCIISSNLPSPCRSWIITDEETGAQRLPEVTQQTSSRIHSNPGLLPASQLVRVREDYVTP